MSCCVSSASCLTCDRALKPARWQGRSLHGGRSFDFVGRSCLLARSARYGCVVIAARVRRGERMVMSALRRAGSLTGMARRCREASVPRAEGFAPRTTRCCSQRSRPSKRRVPGSRTRRLRAATYPSGTRGWKVHKPPAGRCRCAGRYLRLIIPWPATDNAAGPVWVQ
jgi:hypothetical protein